MGRHSSNVPLPFLLEAPWLLCWPVPTGPALVSRVDTAFLPRKKAKVLHKQNTSDRYERNDDPSLGRALRSCLYHRLDLFGREKPEALGSEGDAQGHRLENIGAW